MHAVCCFVRLQILPAKHNDGNKGQALYSSFSGTNSPVYTIEMTEYC